MRHLMSQHTVPLRDWTRMITHLPFASDHKHQSPPLRRRLQNETKKCWMCLRHRHPVQVDAGFGLHLAAFQLLESLPVHLDRPSRHTVADGGCHVVWRERCLGFVTHAKFVEFQRFRRGFRLRHQSVFCTLRRFVTPHRLRAPGNLVPQRSFFGAQMPWPPRHVSLPEPANRPAGSGATRLAVRGP